jgi:hypothetical protein
MSEREQSYGELLVRASFNPSNNNLVDEVKAKTAELIDVIQANKSLDPRLAALAITAFETGAMWGVKLATANGATVITATLDATEPLDKLR